MKETAVEWLHKLSKQRELDKFDWEQAKEMEKEQIVANSKNKWISVYDKVPTERVEFVLLFNADAPKYNQCVYQGVWFSQESNFKSDTNHNLLGTVTHWMPLPDAPKDVNNH